MGPIKDLCVTYEAVNDCGFISEGDTLSGTVSFRLKKDTKIKSIVVKAKGDAHVEWGGDSFENVGHLRYFKPKDFVVAENAQGTVLSQGINQFKFMFKIPEGDMPSSFHGCHGRIVYTLEAKVSRGWLRSSKVKKEINFVSKSILQHEMCPQSGSVNKETGFFSRRQIRMSATVSRKICSPGDSLSVVAKVCNSSSKTMRPKYKLQQITVYRAKDSTNTSTQSLCKMVGDTIAANSERTVSCQIKIPDDAPHTVLNCDIISLDYILKVYLDISFARDPEAAFPLIVIPSSLASLHSNEAWGPYPRPSYSDFPPPAFPAELYPPNTGPGLYGYQAPGLYPQLNRGGNSSQWPQQAGPHGLSSAAFTSSSVLYPALAAPPSFQHRGEPPPYTYTVF